jgi:hypothetical protein
MGSLLSMNVPSRSIAIAVVSMLGLASRLNSSIVLILGSLASRTRRERSRSWRMSSSIWSASVRHFGCDTRRVDAEFVE